MHFENFINLTIMQKFFNIEIVYFCFKRSEVF